MLPRCVWTTVLQFLDHVFAADSVCVAQYTQTVPDQTTGHPYFVRLIEHGSTFITAYAVRTDLLKGKVKVKVDDT